MAEKVKLAELYLDVVARLNKAEQELQKFKRYADKQGRDSGRGFSKGFTIGLAKIAAAWYGIRKALSIAKEAKNLARDAEEIGNKFDTVFESIRGSANRTAESIASDFQLASSTTKELLGNTGDLLVGFGFTEKQALELSDKVNRLAVDLASFSNYSGGAKGASEALTKALLGETESAKSLGIVIRQNTKEFRAQIENLKSTQGYTEQQAKAVLILGQAYTQSKKAVGDFARTSGSLANQERILNEKLKESGELLGNVLVPAFVRVIEFSNQALTSINDYIKTLDKIKKSKEIEEAYKKNAAEVAKFTKLLIELQEKQKIAFSPEVEKAIEKVKIQIQKLTTAYKDLKDAAGGAADTMEPPEEEKPIPETIKELAGEMRVKGERRKKAKELPPYIEDTFVDEIKAGNIKDFSEIGQRAMGAFEDAINSAFDAIKSGDNVFKAMANAFASAIQRMIAEALAFKAVMAIGNMIMPGLGNVLVGARSGGTFQGGEKVASFASGTDWFKVPYDNYPILTHRNEIVKVTPASRAGDEAKILGNINDSIQALSMNLIEVERRVDVGLEGMFEIEGQSLKKVYDKTDRIHGRLH